MLSKLKNSIKHCLAISAWMLSVAGCLSAQEPVLSLQAPASVSAGDVFEISYSINVRGAKSFQAPSFKGLDVIFGPMQSQSSSFQFINGQRSQSFTLSYSYRLRAMEAGEYDFGKASIEVDGKTYFSEPFKLSVSQARQNTSRTAAPASGRNQNPPSPSSASGQVSKDDLFLRAIPSKRNPYVGEQIVLTYRIYTAIPVEQFSIYKTPSNKGFWTEELKIDPQNQQQEVIDGKQYIYADIRKVALFAQEAGQHDLEPMEVEAVAQIPARTRPRQSRNIFDFFEDDFFTPMELVRKNLYSPALQIQAKPLPEEGRPLSFDGLVGDYEISFQHDKKASFRANEAITFSFEVSGKGNIEMIHAPIIQFPPDFEVYEPRIAHNKNVRPTGVSGKASFEYIVVPRHAGVYKIPSFAYSFFNPSSGRYEEKIIPETVLNIEAGKEFSTANTARSNVQIRNNDIEYIQTKASSWKTAGKDFLFSPAFWLCLAGEALAFALALALLKRNRKIQSDLVGLRNRKAAKEAKKCLRKAEKFLKEGKEEEFHIEISQALWGFLANKLNIPTAELSMDNVRLELGKKALDENLIACFIETLEHCEYARFAPKGQEGRSMKQLYDEALDIIYKITGALK